MDGAFADSLAQLCLFGDHASLYSKTGLQLLHTPPGLHQHHTIWYCFAVSHLCHGWFSVGAAPTGCASAPLV